MYPFRDRAVRFTRRPRQCECLRAVTLHSIALHIQADNAASGDMRYKAADARARSGKPARGGNPLLVIGDAESNEAGDVATDDRSAKAMLAGFGDRMDDSTGNSGAVDEWAHRRC